MAFTYIIELLQTVLSTRDAFRNFGTGWGNMIELDAVGWLWFSVPVLGSVSKLKAITSWAMTRQAHDSNSQLHQSAVLRLAYLHAE